MWSAAGGFGDPMERERSKCGRMSRQRRGDGSRARAIYGVVLDDGGTARCFRDADVARDYAARRVARGAQKRPPRLSGETVLRITDNLVIRAEADGPHHACAKCDTDLGPARDNYKDHCIVEVRPVTDAVPLAGDPARYIERRPNSASSSARAAARSSRTRSRSRAIRCCAISRWMSTPPCCGRRGRPRNSQWSVRGGGPTQPSSTSSSKTSRSSASR